MILTPTLNITPNPNSDFENFLLFIKRGLYSQYFYIFSLYEQPKIIEITVRARRNG